MLDLFTGFTQNTRLLRLTTPLGRNKLIVECMRGEEGLSQCYEFKITVLSTDAAIASKSLLGQPALLELLTTVSRTDLRPFHGHITSVESLKADGGLARYAISLSPWYAFLAHGRDSRIFQDKTVFEILDALFGGWLSLGKLAPAWRFDLRERSAYPRRSITTQYQESNMAFAERLMREEGLFYYFEHLEDATSPSLGSHTMVIADHNGSFRANAQAQVSFTQPGAVMKDDSIDRWRTETRLLTNAIEIRSWDYRAFNDRPVIALSATNTGAPMLTSRDAPGIYAYQTREQGQRIADNQMLALDAAREVHIGAGTVRMFAPGTTFTLNGQAQLDLAASDDARNFAIVRVVHLAHNNLSMATKVDVNNCLGQSPLAALIDEERQGSLHAIGKDKGERPLYRNRIDAIPANVPFRSMSVDGHGRLLHPRPSVRGQQTAIVVGPAGAVTHTDRDHRIKVQFHWQRGAGDSNLSHSRLNHPAPDGHTGAPGNDESGTWVRIATPLAPVAGANWGSSAVPRVGSEVLVDFIDGNIDRPVVIGSLYNGRGQADAQSNALSQGAGVATGNASAWFPGESGAHAHPAVLSGLKSQEMRASQSGMGGYGQLVFDDTGGQSRIVLQRHATAHRGTAELNLGHLRHQTDNQRLAAAGFGAELKTEHSAALRTGKGLLLTADARRNGSGSQLDSREAQAQIESSHCLQVAMAATAQKHNAQLNATDGKAEAEPEELPAITDAAQSIKVLGTNGSGISIGTENFEGGKGEGTAYSKPQLQLSSPFGIVAATPASAILAGGNTSSVTAGQDINFASQGNTFHAVTAGISLFTYGKATKSDKPNQEVGIKLHAASGKVSSQSQTDETKVIADKVITLASTTKNINIAGKNHVMMTAQGAFIKLEGGNIMIHGPGKMEFKATMKDLAGPMSSSFVPPSFPIGEIKPNQLVIERLYHDQEPLAGAPYQVFFSDGSSKKGVLDGAGRGVLNDVPAGAAHVIFGAMPGPYARKSMVPMPGYKPVPKQGDIDALINKYADNEESN
jgi:type VI secretion system secreted protein VgrG